MFLGFLCRSSLKVNTQVHLDRFFVSSVKEPLGRTLSYKSLPCHSITVQCKGVVFILKSLYLLTEINHKGANLRLEIVKTMKHLLSEYRHLLHIFFNREVVFGGIFS